MAAMFLCGLPVRWHLPIIPSNLDESLGWAIGCLVGAAAAGCYRTAYRVVGLMPPAATVLAASAVATFLFDYRPAWLVPTHGLAMGACFAAHIAYLIRLTRLRLRQPNIGAMPHWLDFVLCFSVPIAVFVLLTATWQFKPTPSDTERAAIGFVAAWVLLAAFAWFRLFRASFELCVEALAAVGYRVRAAGPGLRTVPYHGPLIVIANHACWWDPLFLGVRLPRPITPMMTSVFFDIWFLRPFMAYVFRAIRVSEVAVRRQTPEIEQAIAVLDAGHCLVIFPEGQLRRKDEVPLRRFGRGIWEILRARPDTPVVACWIEGNWGSWTSYAGGPPLKNKRPDFLRRIGLGMSEPFTVPAETLAHHMATRCLLMNHVMDARKHIGLQPLPPVEYRIGTPDADQPE